MPSGRRGHAQVKVGPVAKLAPRACRSMVEGYGNSGEGWLVPADEEESWAAYYRWPGI